MKISKVRFATQILILASMSLSLDSHVQEMDDDFLNSIPAELIDQIDIENNQVDDDTSAGGNGDTDGVGDDDGDSDEDDGDDED